MVVEGSQSFGSGGSPSSEVNPISSTTITLTSDWEPFAAVLTVPSITGKTVGTDGNDRLDINFWTSAGSDFNTRTNSLGIQTIGVDLWGIHIKRGTHTADATEAYRAPELGPELARCQRYAWVPDATDSTWAMFPEVDSGTSIGRSLSIPWPVTMRAVPTVSYALGFAGAGGVSISRDKIDAAFNAFNAASSNNITITLVDAEL